MNRHEASALDSTIGGALLRPLSAFREASTQLLHARTLQRRVERKYVLPQALLEPLLGRLRADYALVQSAGRLAATYDTLYFDTSERQLYHDHRRGRRPRCKVRIRHHVDRGCTFLEVKSKGGSGRTTKARLALPFRQTDLDADTRRFIDAHSRIGAIRLVPCLSITFFRITLVGVTLEERVTFDCDLEFRDACVGAHLPGVVIAEIKQPRYSNANGAVRAFRRLHIQERALSKYCLGTARLMPVPSNVFKPAFRAVERLSPCESC